jgi:YesN/AraC family two-component response regulator
MTGRDIIGRLEAERLPNAFIMMTGQGDERLAVEIMKHGAADYLIKDTELLDRLPGVISKLCQNLETRRRLQAAEAALQQRLVEKEALLREIHHRVKNNLTVISSLLSLQSDTIDSPAAAARAFEKTRDRVLAMALVHEKLYESADCAGIRLQDYLDDLTIQLLATHQPAGQIRPAEHQHQLRHPAGSDPERTDQQCPAIRLLRRTERHHQRRVPARG